MHARAPIAVTKHVMRLARRVSPTQQPLFVPIATASDGSPNECFASVEAVTATQGGQRVIGWALWEWPHTMIEAELHAIWKSPAGDLLDVTPRSDGESQILFLPDPGRQYSGEYVDNVRMALRDDALILDFIRISEEIFRRTRTGRPGVPTRLPTREIVPLALFHGHLTEMLKAGCRDHDPCFCGSGKKYKKCHALPPP